MLVEEFIAGTDVTVPLLEGRGDEGVLLPVDYLVDPAARSRFNIYDYRLKTAESSKVPVRCPPDLPRDVVARLRAISKMAVRALGIRDVGRIDFRVGEDGRIYLLEVNALPSLERGASLFAATAREGLDYAETLHAIVESAARRQGLVVKPGARKRRPAEPLRIGFTYNVKRVDPKAGNDAEAEYDPPETIDAIRDALAEHGHVTSARGHRRAAAGAHADAASTWSSTSPRASRAATARRGAGAVRAARHPVHRLRLGHAGDRARQGAVARRCCCSTTS